MYLVSVNNSLDESISCINLYENERGPVLCSGLISLQKAVIKKFEGQTKHVRRSFYTFQDIKRQMLSYCFALPDEIM